MAKCVRCGSSGLTLKVDFDSLCPACHDLVKAETAEQISRLQTFYDEYKAIPDAKAQAESIVSEAQGEADSIRQVADEYAETTRREAEIAADTIKRKANELQKAAEYTSTVVLAELNEKISVLLKDAASDFHFKSRASIAAMYTKERKTDAASPSEHSITINALTPSAFRKQAAKKGFVAFDLETTGLSPKRDRIIEIAAIKYENGDEVDRYETLVNPGIHIPEAASDVNHIYDDMVNSAPYIDEVLPEFIEFVGDKPLIAHNANFDIAFIERALVKNECAAALDYGDSLQMTRKVYPDLPNHKLDTIAEHLGITVSDRHRATGDCEALGEIVKACCEE